jgi:hypothetical protein
MQATVAPSNDEPTKARSRVYAPPVLRAGTFDLPAFAYFDSTPDVPIRHLSAAGCKQLRTELQSTIADFAQAVRLLVEEIDAREAELDVPRLPLDIAA